MAIDSSLLGDPAGPPPNPAAEHYEATASEHFRGFQQALAQAPQASRQAFASATGTTGAIRQLARSEAQAVATLEAERADLSRRGATEAAMLVTQRIDERRAAAAQRIDDLATQARTLIAVTEAALTVALVPELPDSSQSMLARHEIDGAVAGRVGNAAAAAMRNLVGQDAALDAELLHGYGERVLARAVAADPQLADKVPEVVRAFRLDALQRLAQVGRTDTARAAAAALTGISQVRGAVDAERAAGMARLGWRAA